MFNKVTEIEDLFIWKYYLKPLEKMRFLMLSDKTRRDAGDSALRIIPSEVRGTLLKCSDPFAKEAPLQTLSKCLPEERSEALTSHH